MGQHDIDRTGKSQDTNPQTSKRPQPAEQAAGTSKDATPSPAPGEKMHGDKLQNATSPKR